MSIWATQPEAAALALLWGSLRTGAALALLPALGGTLIPLRVRIGIAGAVGWLALDIHGVTPPADPLAASALLLAAGELLIGAVAGLMLHAAFAGALIAGEWLAQAAGLGFATAMDPAGAPAPVLGLLLALATWSLFLASDGHLLLLRVLVESYGTLPNAAALMQPQALAQVTALGSFAFVTGLLVALPLGGLLLLLNLVLAVAAKSAPQLNLFSVGFPAMLLAAVAALPLAAPVMFASLARALAEAQGQLETLLL